MIVAIFDWLLREVDAIHCVVWGGAGFNLEMETSIMIKIWITVLVLAVSSVASVTASAACLYRCDSGPDFQICYLVAGDPTVCPAFLVREW